MSNIACILNIVSNIAHILNIVSNIALILNIVSNISNIARILNIVSSEELISCLQFVLLPLQDPAARLVPTLQ